MGGYKQMNDVMRTYLRTEEKIVEYLTKFYCDKTATELIVPTKKTYDLFKEKYQVDRNIYIIPTGIEIERFYDIQLTSIRMNRSKNPLLMQGVDCQRPVSACDPCEGKRARRDHLYHWRRAAPWAVPQRVPYRERYTAAGPGRAGRNSLARSGLPG